MPYLSDDRVPTVENNKLALTKCHYLLLENNHTEKHVTVKKLAYKNWPQTFWKKINFETEHLSRPFDIKSWH